MAPRTEHSGEESSLERPGTALKLRAWLASWVGALVRLAGAPQKTVSLLEPIVAASPGSVAAHSELSRALARLGRNSDASRHARTAVTIAPSYRNHLVLARLLRRSRELDAAIAILEQARHIRFTDAQAYYMLAEIHRDQGDFKLAYAEIERALELDGRTTVYRELRDKILIDLGRDNGSKTGATARAPTTRRRPMLRCERGLIERVAAIPRTRAQKREYRRRGLDRVENRFVLYRVIGNDLPPRHRFGQSIDNLQFILDHEPSLAACEKRWVVNRIVNPEMERRIIDLLESRDQAYLLIPFHDEAYAEIDFVLDCFPEPGILLPGALKNLPSDQRALAVDQTYHEKNLYAINNNGARNAALRDGRSRAKWILPWDGNCFVTERAWREITDAVISSSHVKYFIVPMARSLDDSQLLEPSFRPEPVEEPQIIFRCDARETFDDRMRYGRRPKIELLRRLGVPGTWDKWHDEPWEAHSRSPSPEAGQFRAAGWVARLHSGSTGQEASSYLASQERIVARRAAIRGLLDDLDERIARQATGTGALCLWDDSTLARIKDQRCRGEPDVPEWVESVVTWAESSHLPALAAPQGRSGRSEPNATSAFLHLVPFVTSMALAWAVTGRRELAERAASAIGVIFADLDEVRTREGDTTIAATVQRGSWKSTRWADLRIPCLLDALRLLGHARVLTDEDRSASHRWARACFDWLSTSAEASKAKESTGGEGTCYELHLASVAAYLDDVPALLAALWRARVRLVTHFDAAGPARCAMPPARGWSNDAAFDLECWLHLARVSLRGGHNLWTFGTAANQAPLAKACEQILQQLAGAQGSRLDRDYGSWLFQRYLRFSCEARPGAPRIPASGAIDSLDLPCPSWPRPWIERAPDSKAGSGQLHQ